MKKNMTDLFLYKYLIINIITTVRPITLAFFHLEENLSEFGDIYYKIRTDESETGYQDKN
jgi:hypothetical protein